MSAPFIIIFVVIIILMIKRRKQVGKLFPEHQSSPVDIRKKYKLVCRVCENHLFHKREGLLNTGIISYLWLSCFNQAATCFVCSECGHIEWFHKPKEQSKFSKEKKRKNQASP